MMRTGFRSWRVTLFACCQGRFWACETSKQQPRNLPEELLLLLLRPQLPLLAPVRWTFSKLIREEREEVDVGLIPAMLLSLGTNL